MAQGGTPVAAHSAESHARAEELQRIAAQLDEERGEFEAFRLAQSTGIAEREAACDAERQKLAADRATFDDAAAKTTARLDEEAARLHKERDAFETERVDASKSLAAEQEALRKLRETLEQEQEEWRLHAADAQAKLQEKAAELERLQEEVVQQKYKLVRERRGYDDERKQLARLLLGMGQKISTGDEAVPASAYAAAGIDD